MERGEKGGGREDGKMRGKEKRREEIIRIQTLSHLDKWIGEREPKIFIAHFPLLLLLSNFAYRLPWHFQLSNLILL